MDNDRHPEVVLLTYQKDVEITESIKEVAMKADEAGT
jgi:hypothetical protein